MLMLVVDELEEHTMLCLERLDSDMDCAHFVLRKRLREVQKLHRNTSDLDMLTLLEYTAICSSDQSSGTSRRRILIRNTVVQTTYMRHPELDPTIPIRHLLSIKLHNFTRCLHGN